MLEGELVRLRALEPDDLERCHRWMNDPEATRSLEGGRYCDLLIMGILRDEWEVASRSATS